MPEVKRERSSGKLSFVRSVDRVSGRARRSCLFARIAVRRLHGRIAALSDLGKGRRDRGFAIATKAGLKGTWKDTRFELTGRAQYRHELGGFWDEWYATFSNGWVGWLAEAQGRFYLTFFQPLAAGYDSSVVCRNSARPVC